jgi:molecular chaperone GrpE
MTMQEPKPSPEQEKELQAAAPTEEGQAVEQAAPGAQGAEGQQASSSASSGDGQPVTLSAREFEELRRRASEAEQYRDRLLRTAADFDNFRKRSARERQEVLDHAHQALLTRLIPVLDSFEAALAALESHDEGAREKLEQGVRLVWQQLRSVLQEAGLTEIDATGQPFDPTLHEAVAVEERTDVPDHHVVRQLRKGYKLRNRLLRPASVVVAQAPRADESGAGTAN